MSDCGQNLCGLLVLGKEPKEPPWNGHRPLGRSAELLGQGHDFWTGAVWGLGGVALAKSVIPLSNLATLGPLALGWVAGDFVALAIDARNRSGSEQARDGTANLKH